MNRFFKLLGSYIKRHITLLLAFALSIAVFAVVFSLYDLPTEPIWYAAILCGALLLVLGVLRFSAFRRRMNALEQLKARIVVALDGLPAPTSVLEETYQALLRTVHDSKCAAQAENDKAFTDLQEYYTLWAHQIKTPISAMRLLLESDDNADPRLVSELFKVEQYVEMVLSYVRLDPTVSDFVLSPCKLDDIVRAAIRRYAALFIGKKLTVDYTPTARVVLTDEKWLQFLIEQLLSNAIKYTPEGGKVTLFDDGHMLFLSDTGIGIAAEDLPRVFDLGYTGYNGRTDKKSTGIGLSLCKRIAQKLGHSIAIQSIRGDGTTVCVGIDSVKRARRD